MLQLPAGAMLALHAIHFELRGCDMCNVLPNAAMLQNVDAIHIETLRQDIDRLL